MLAWNITTVFTITWNTTTDLKAYFKHNHCRLFTSNIDIDICLL